MQAADRISVFSDTTATALTFVFIQLALYPKWIQHLREEMDPIFAALN
jgi:cytochrome P450